MILDVEEFLMNNLITLETSKNIAELPLFIDETPAISIAAMSNRLEELKDCMA